MKPLRLVMEGIGPFLKKTTINFDRIGDDQLFLIHGATGAGKTFIFDSICFALYGKTPSDRETNLRSDYAAADLKPYIKFTFSLGKEVFEVSRNLEYERAAKRGSGSVTQKADQCIRSLTTWPTEDGCVLKTKLSEVDKFIRDRLCLGMEQFAQVILLPQGKFQQLLLSGSSERERLLEQLFDVDSYNSIQNSLSTWYNEEKKNNQKRITELSALRNNLMPILQELRDMEGVEEVVEAHIISGEEAISVTVSELEHKVDELNKARDESSKRFESAKQLTSEFSNQKKVEGKLKAHDDGQEMLNELTKEKQAAEAAEKLRSLIKDQDEAAGAATIAEKALADAEDALREAAGALAAVEEEAKEIPNLQHSAEKMKNQVITLTPLIALADKRANLTTTIDGKVKEEEEAQKAVDKTSSDLREKRTEENKLKEKIAELSTGSVHLETLKHREEALTELIRLEKEGLDAELAVEKADKTKTDVAEKLKAAETKLGRLQSLREGSLTGEIAASLTDNTPCPVCGSVEHPSPAPLNREAVTIDEIKGAETKVKELNGKVADASSTLAEATGLQKTVDKGRKDLESKVGEINGETPADELNRIRQTAEEEEARSKELKLLESRLDYLRTREIPDTEKSCEDAKNALQVIAITVSSLTTEQKMLDGQWQEAAEKEGIGELLSKASKEEGWLKALIAELEEDAKLKTDKAADIVLSQQRNNADITARTEVIKTIKANQVIPARKKLEEAGQRLTRAIEESEFSTREQVVESLKDESWHKETKETLDNSARERRDLEVELKGITKRIAGAEEPELDKLEKDLSTRKAAHTVAAEELSRLKGKQERLIECRKKTCEMEAEAGRQADEMRVMERLQREMCGQGTPKISFKRFFLAQRLEEVLAQATVRMQALTHNRFSLHRREEGERANQQTGLDLLVFDNNTGTEREVRSLSGGQRFLASLSMALGLADVVTARSGGVKLDTLFIDEGFGSLDENMLQLVLSGLDRLRKGRMVGLISHVPELRRQITNRIEVHSEQTGSTVSLTTG